MIRNERSGAVISVLLVLALLFALVGAANAQQSVVEKYRGQYPTPMGADNTLKLLKQVAAETHFGIYRKTTGSNCNGYSCDIVCFGGTEGVDILSDSEGAARPTWNAVHDLDGSKCEKVVDDGGGGGGGGGDTTSISQKQLDALLQLVDQLQHQRDEASAQNAKLVEIIESLKATTLKVRVVK